MDSSVPTKLSETCLLIISVEALKWKEVGRQKEEDCSNGLDSRENSSVTFSLEKPKEGVGGSQEAVICRVEQRSKGPTPAKQFWGSG